MNKQCFKTVFSKRLGAIVVVSEITGNSGKACGGFTGHSLFANWSQFVGKLSCACALVLAAFVSPLYAAPFAGVAAPAKALSLSATALPTGGQVVQGAASISQNGAAMSINQTTSKAVVNWQSFDIGSSAKVTVDQPNTQSVLLSRVVSDNPSQILGQLSANGQIVLVNPNGVTFGRDGSVSAAGLTASTLGISDADFMAGKMNFNRNGSTAALINQGSLKAAPGGYVALLGATVSNEGTITVPQGTAYLAAAESVKLPLSGTGKIKLELLPSTVNAMVANQAQGVIVAEGGQVFMQASAVPTIVASVLQSGSVDTSGEQAGAVKLLADGGEIKVDGRITANSSGQDDQGQLRKGGDIVIGRDEETGVLAKFTNVSGARLESNKGFVETSGDVLATTGTRVHAGEWLLDPYNITIAASGASGTTYASNYTSATDSIILASDINANLNAGTSVTLATGAGGASAGDININASIAKTAGGDATLTLKAHNDILSNFASGAGSGIASTAGKLNVVLNADSDASGAGGIKLMYTTINSFGGNITLGGGSAGTGASYAVGTSGTSNVGIYLETANFNAAGGDITLNGKGTTIANAGFSQHGIFRHDGLIQTSGAGNITYTGIGGVGSGGSNAGIYLQYVANTTGSATGTVTLNGTGGTSTGNGNHGIKTEWTPRVTTTGGNLVINATGGGTGASSGNIGLDLESAGWFSATGSGTVTVTGTGGSGTGGNNHGIYTGGTWLSYAAANIKSANGAITVTGTEGAGTGSTGISLMSTGNITSTGNATVTVNTDNLAIESTGSLSAGTGSLNVLNRTANTLINLGGSDVLGATGTRTLGLTSTEIGRMTASTLTIGQSGATTAGNVTVSSNVTTDARNFKLVTGGNITMAANAVITAPTNGNVELNTDSTSGVITLNSASGITSNGGNVTFTTDSYSGGNTEVINAGTGTVTFQNRTAGTLIDVAGADAAGKLGVSNAELNRITAATTKVGSSTAGNLTVSGAITTASTTGNLHLQTNGTATVNAAVSSGAGLFVQTTGSAIATTATMSGTNISLDNTNGTINSSTGAITAGSAAGTTTTGVTVGAAITASNNVNIQGVSITTTTAQGGVVLNANVTGTGGAVNISSKDIAGGSNYAFYQSTGTISSGTGGVNINVLGSGNNSALDLYGNITSTGAVSLTGNAGIGNGNGIWTSGTISIAGASVTVSGTGGSTGGHGMNISSGATITANDSSGFVNMTGNAGAGITSGVGIVTASPTSGTVGITGPSVSMTGTGGSNGGSGLSLASGTTITGTNNSGSVVLSGTAKKIGISGVFSNSAIVGASDVSVTGLSTVAGANTAALVNLNSGSITGASGKAINLIGGTYGSANITSNGAAVKFSNSTSRNDTYSGVISNGTGVGSVENVNGGQTLAGTNTYTGTTTVTAGTLQVGTGAATGKLGTGDVSVLSNANLTFYRNDSGASAYTIANNIAGAGVINFNGTNDGTLSTQGQSAYALTGNNSSFSGTINLSQSRLGLTAANQLGTSALTVNSGAELWTNGSFTLSNAMSLAGNGWNESAGYIGAVRLGSATLSGPITLTGDTRLASYGSTGTVSGAISGAKNLELSDGTLVLTGTNTYSGTTIIASNATLQLGNNTTTGSITSSSAITDNGNLVIKRSDAITVAQNITGTGTLTNSGAGTTTLTGTNIYSGSTTISAGTLQIGNGGTTGTLGTNAGAISNNGTLAINRSNQFTLPNVINGTGGLSQLGSGTTILTADNTYSGATIVSGGTLQVGNAGTTGTLGNTTGVTLSNNANLSFSKSANTTIDKAISGNGNVSANITGDLALTSNMALTGTNTINLTASGSITETAGSLAATNLYLTATSGSIGSSTNRINSNVTYLAMSSAGDQFVTETDVLTAAARTTGTGNIDIQTTSGTLWVASVNGINGVVAGGTAGNVTLSGTTASGRGLSIINAVTASHGNVSLSGTTSSTTNLESGVYSSSTVTGNNITMAASATGATGRVLGYYGVGGIFNASQQLSLTGSSVIANGLYTFGGSYLSGSGMTLSGTSTNGGGVGMDNNVTVTNGSSGGISITGTSSSSQNAVSLAGSTLSNGGGNVEITAVGGNVLSSVGDPTNWGGSNRTNTITNSGTGSVQITAGNGSANNSGAINGSVLAITQNANGGVQVSSSGTGDVTSPRIVNAGTGNITIAAGSAIAAGTGTGGQVKTVSGNTVMQSSSGKTFIYSGNASDTGNLSNIGGFSNGLFLSTIGSDTKNAASNTAYASTIAGGASTQILFREKVALTATLNNIAITYSDNIVNTAITTALQGANASGNLTTASNAGMLNILKSDVMADIPSGGASLTTALSNASNKSSSNNLKASNTGYAIDLTGTNYSLSGLVGYLIVNKKDLAITATAADKVYDSTSTATETLVSNKLAGDTLTLTKSSATFANKNVGTGKTVTVSGLSISGTDAGNYNLTNTSTNTTANITQAPLTVTATSVTKTYDAGLSATGTGTVSTLAGSDTLSNAGSQAFTDKNVGTSKTVRASGVTIKDVSNADMTGNYNISYVDNTTSAITRANLIATANADARFVTQSDIANFKGVSYSGFVGGETSAVLGGTLSISRTNANTNVGAGTYAGTLVASGLTSGNYNISYTNGDYTILPADRLLVTTSNQTVTYGTAPTFTTTAEYLDSQSNTIKVLTQTGTNNNYTFNDNAGTTINFELKSYTGKNIASTSTSGNTVVGNYVVKDTAYTQSGNNFNGTPVFIGTLTVAQKSITPSASGVTKVYDGTTAMGNVIIGMSGKVTNDVVNISGTGAYSQKNVGSLLGYAITDISLTAADAANYYLAGGSNSFSGNNGVISAAPLVITSANVSKVYDRSTSASGLAQATNSTQTFGSDSLSGGAFAFTTASAGTGNKVVTVSGVTVNDGNNGNNYAVSYVNNTTSTITPKQLNASMTASNKTYDGSTSASVTGSSSDIINGDTVTFANTSATFNDKNVGASKQVTISGISLGGSGAGNYALQNTTALTNATITAKSLTASMTAANKIYNGNTTASVTGNSSDIVSGDTVTFNNTSATFNDKNVGTSKQVSISGISLGGTDAGNYALQNTTATSSANITPKSLTAVMVAANKTYNGNTAASVTGSSSDIINGDTVTFANASATFSDKNVGNGKAVTVTGLSIGGTDAGNYALQNTTATSTANINAKSLTVSMVAADKIYDGNTTANVTASSNDIINGDTVTISNTGATFDNKNVGTNKTVTVSGLNISGTDAANYSLSNTSTTTTATITKKDVTLTAITAANKTYDGGTLATITAGAISGTVGAETLSTSGSGGFADKNAGPSKTVTVVDVTALTKTDGTGTWSNYNLTTTGSLTTTAAITKKDVTLSAITASDKVYNGSSSATITAGTITGTAGSETLTVSGSGNFIDKNVGTAKTVTVTDVTGLTKTDGTGAWSNYHLTTTGNLTTTANITQAPLTVTANAVTKTYDGSLSATGSGTVGALATANDSINYGGTQIFLDANAGASKTVRASGVTIKDASNVDMTGNYNINYVDNTTSAINQAPLTIKPIADARFVTQTDTVGFNGVNYSGLVNGESSSVLSGTLSITRTNANTNVGAGNYVGSLVASGLTSSNYNISYTNGDYTIVPANTLLIKTTNVSAAYGTAPTYSTTAQYMDGTSVIHTLTTSNSGATTTFSDNAGGSATMTLQPYSGSAVAASSTSGNTVVGNYLIQDTHPVITGSNFLGAPVFVGNLSVTPKAVTPNATGVSKVYDGSTTMSNATLGLTGQVTGDRLSISGSGVFNQKNSGNQVGYTFGNLTLSGSDQANYYLSGGNILTATNGTITPAALSLSTTNVIKTYDGTLSAAGTPVVANGYQLFSNDSLSGGNFVFANKNIGNGNKMVSTSGVTINDGNHGANYTVSYVNNTTSTITPAALTITAGPTQKTYDGTLNASGSGVVGTLAGAGDIVASAGTLSFTDKNAGTGKTVTVSGAQIKDGSGADMTGNYAITYASSSNGVITRAPATISETNQTVIYNGATQTQGAATFSGFVAGDTVQATGMASGRNVGLYTSSLGATGADVGNYDITFVNAPLSITPRAASLGTASQSLVYNGATQTLSGTQGSGFIAGDALTFIGLPSGQNVGQYTASLGVTGADAGNYTITYGNGVLNITPRSASITAPVTSLVYNGQTQTQNAAILNGVVAGDNIQVTGLANGRNAGTYVSNLEATGSDLGNYNITYTNNPLTITKAPISFVNTQVADKVYDGETTATVKPGTVTGLVNGESLTVTNVSGQFDTAATGQGKAVTVVYSLADGAGGGLISNYAWSPVQTTANILSKTSTTPLQIVSPLKSSGYSRISYLGFTGKSGAALGTTGEAHDSQCSAANLQDCLCEQPEGPSTNSSLEICVVPSKKNARAESIEWHNNLFTTRP